MIAQARNKSLSCIAACILAVGLTSPGWADDYVVGFTTPSNNIQCGYFLYNSQFECYITQTAWLPENPEDEDCEFDTGKTAAMGLKGKPSGHWWCASDSWMHEGIKQLRYGKEWRHKGIVCDLTTQRLRCKNPDGHGWTMSRRDVKFF